MQKELINLNSRKETFEVEGRVQNKAVKGSFTVHFPSIMDRINIETNMAKALEGCDLKNMQITAYNALRAMCHLKEVLDKKPNWFDFEKLDSYDLIFEVYNKALEFEDNFRKKAQQSGLKEDSKQE